ncbi:hypothetical protein PoB_004546500 [Plakobranchus ocellatus]|uniref:60S ribosomal protein L21 n=1 Tax=Plakobranchus ocellatus TaxID=259542 RepID=A0AAV4BIS7_9GAST|nr:hypothetical protein PoB_004546500 [Plakobranchus ocellatus]
MAQGYPTTYELHVLPYRRVKSLRVAKLPWKHLGLIDHVTMTSCDHISQNGCARRNCRSFRNGCPVHVKLRVRAGKTFNKLQIVSAYLEYNHIVPAKTDKQVKAKDLHNLWQKSETETTEDHSKEEQVWKTLQDMVAEDPGSHFIFSEPEKILVFLKRNSF